LRIRIGIESKFSRNLCNDDGHGFIHGQHHPLGRPANSHTISFRTLVATDITALYGKPKMMDFSGAVAQREIELSDLMGRIAHRDEGALAELYKHMSRMIYAFSLRRLSEPQAAEEVVVETMYEVWKGAPHFMGRSLVTTWILGIARHKAIDKLRFRGVEVCETLGEEAESVVDESPSVYEMIAARQRAGQVMLCLETLPDEQRECLHLVFFEDAPLAEIAIIQDCPQNTVKTRLFHARRKMKACLEQQIERMEFS
jgi:RNA polymerase sigma-70 factor, ECF subfamily